MSINTAIRRQVRRVLYRAYAWQRVFLTGPDNTLSPDARVVVAHLKRWARYGKPPVVKDSAGRTDALETGRMIGRQEAVQLMVECLALDERTLTNLQEDLPDE